MQCEGLATGGPLHLKVTRNQQSQQCSDKIALAASARRGGSLHAMCVPVCVHGYVYVCMPVSLCMCICCFLELFCVNRIK